MIKKIANKALHLITTAITCSRRAGYASGVVRSVGEDDTLTQAQIDELLGKEPT